MAKSLTKTRKHLEVFLIKLGLAILPYWPRWLIRACACLAGITAYYCVPKQRRLTMANLEIAFGQKKSAAEKKHIALRAFKVIALNFIDYFWFSRRSLERVAKYVMIDQSIAAYLPAPPAVVVTAHFGNWELLSRKMAAAGYAHMAVSAPLSNPAADKIIESFRTTDNAKMIPMRGAIRGLLRGLHQGVYIALLLDQNTKPRDGGLFVDFFGLPIPMSTSAAILAERVNAPIIAAFCLMREDGKYQIYALPPIRTVASPVNGPDSVRLLTQKIAAAFQGEIEKHPEQWMWMYKRWKHINPGSPAGAYPYYAKPLF